MFGGSLRAINMKRFYKTNGFTLIEMILVVGIIAIMATMLLTVLNPFNQFAKAADARRKSDLSQIQKALESYYADNGRYPPNAVSCKYSIQGNNGDANDCIEWGSSWQPYMNIVPEDPTTGHTYIYYVDPNGQYYYLYANLSRGTLDPQVCSNGACVSPSGSGIIMQTACGAACNFGLSSPNVSP